MAFSNLNLSALLKWPSTYQANVYCALDLQNAIPLSIAISVPPSTAQSSHPASTGGSPCHSTCFCIMVICSIWGCCARPLSSCAPVFNSKVCRNSSTRTECYILTSNQPNLLPLHPPPALRFIDFGIAWPFRNQQTSARQSRPSPSPGVPSRSGSRPRSFGWRSRSRTRFVYPIYIRLCPYYTKIFSSS